MLTHLVYVSSRKPECTTQEIDKILAACNKNNKELDITGILLYSDSKFVQYLEGENKAIMTLYDKIKTDDRHRNAVLISHGLIKERSFPKWQMGHKKMDFASITYRNEMSEEDHQTFQKVLAGGETNRAIKVIKKLFY